MEIARWNGAGELTAQVRLMPLAPGGAARRDRASRSRTNKPVAGTARNCASHLQRRLSLQLPFRNLACLCQGLGRCLGTRDLLREMLSGSGMVGICLRCQLEGLPKMHRSGGPRTQYHWLLVAAFFPFCKHNRLFLLPLHITEPSAYHTVDTVLPVNLRLRLAAWSNP